MLVPVEAVNSTNMVKYTDPFSFKKNFISYVARASLQKVFYGCFHL